MNKINRINTSIVKEIQVRLGTDGSHHNLERSLSKETVFYVKPG